jgi:hypothetical protein
MSAINRTVSAYYQDREIRVTNHWFRGASLFVDGICCASTRELVALDKSKPRLTATVEVNGQPHEVQVFVWTSWRRVHLKICVDGERVAGDDF